MSSSEDQNSGSPLPSTLDAGRPPARGTGLLSSSSVRGDIPTDTRVTSDDRSSLTRPTVIAAAPRASSRSSDGGQYFGQVLAVGQTFRDSLDESKPFRG